MNHIVLLTVLVQQINGVILMDEDAHSMSILLQMATLDFNLVNSKLVVSVHLT